MPIDHRFPMGREKFLLKINKVDAWATCGAVGLVERRQEQSRPALLLSRSAQSHKLLLFSLTVALAVGLVGFALLLPKFDWVKEWRAEVLAAKALSEMEEGNLSGAQRHSIAATQLAPTLASSRRAAARLAARARHPQVFSLFASLAEVEALTVEDEVEMALAALEMHRFDKVQDTLTRLQMEESPRLTALKGRFLAQMGQWEEAAGLLGAVLDAEELTPGERFTSAGQLLSAPQLADRLSGVAALHTLAEKNSFLRPLALESIVAAEQLPLFERESALRLRQAEAASDNAEMIRLGQWEISLRPQERQPILERLESLATEPEAQRAYGSLLLRSGESEALLRWLPLREALGHRDLFLVWLDASAGLGRWKDVLTALQGEGVPLPETLRQLYLGRAFLALHEQSEARRGFEAALRHAKDDPQLQVYLAGVFQTIGQMDLAVDALQSLTSDPAAARMAFLALVQLFRASGQTENLLRTLEDMSRRWPEDNAVDNDTTYLRLLLRQQIPAQRQRARQSFAENPAEFPRRMTLALASLLDGSPEQALDLFADSQVPLQFLLPWQKNLFACVLAANGMRGPAQEIWQSIPSGELLPEEMRLSEHFSR
jgi:tetratricopeptide (TPR) repeat protein